MIDILAKNDYVVLALWKARTFILKKGTILTLRKKDTPCLVITDDQLLSAGFDTICKTYFCTHGYSVFCVNLKLLSEELRFSTIRYLRDLNEKNGTLPFFLVVDRREIAYTIEEKDGDAFIFTKIHATEKSDDAGNSQPEHQGVSSGRRPIFRSSHSGDAPLKKSTTKKKLPVGSNGANSPKNGSNGAGKKDAKPRKPREKQKGGSASRHIGV